MADKIIVGDFMDSLDSFGKKLELNIQPMDVIEFWPRCNMISNFTAHYLVTDFPEKNSIYNSLSVILNELIENAVKFTEKKEIPISISLQEDKNNIFIETINYIGRDQLKSFRDLADRLTDKTAVNNNYINYLTDLVQNGSKSSIGLLTLINYYNVDFSFRIIGPDEKENGLYKICIQTKIDIKELVP